MTLSTAYTEMTQYSNTRNRASASGARTTYATGQRGRVALVTDEQGKPLLYMSKESGTCNRHRG